MKTVLLASGAPAPCVRALADGGYRVVRLPPFSSLPTPVADHADLLLSPLPAGELLVPRAYYEENKALFDVLDVVLVLDPSCPGNAYPADVLLDALPRKETLYGKEGAVSPLLRSYYRSFIPVRQGYARCSVAMLSDDCAVTADRGLADALRRDGVSVLTIRPGHILLPGYDTGLIGGAGGRLGEGLYAFFGDLFCHPDGETIAAFAAEHKIKTVSLGGGPLSDHGGLVVL